jgi:hypothetical protein
LDDVFVRFGGAEELLPAPAHRGPTQGRLSPRLGLGLLRCISYEGVHPHLVERTVDCVMFTERGRSLAQAMDDNDEQ